MTVTGTGPDRHRWGVFGYIVDSDHRTRNALLLLPWVVGGAVATAIAVATPVVVVLLSLETAAMIVGLSTASAGGVAVLARWHRRSTPSDETPKPGRPLAANRARHS